MEANTGPTFSRRHVLAMAGALATIRVEPALLRAYPRQFWATAADGDKLALARFTPHVGSQFEVRTSATQTVRMTLAEATAWAPRPADRPGLSGEAFSLTFAGGGTKAFDHGTYTVVHPALGTFPLFLAVVDRAKKAQHYQAVVDRRALRP